MKIAMSLLVVIISLSCTDLTTTSNEPTATPPDSSAPLAWPVAVKCAQEPIRDIFATVSRILLASGPGELISDDGAARLKDLAKEHGTEVVACYVRRVVADFTRQGAAANEERQNAAARGEDFLKDVGTTATLAP